MHGLACHQPQPDVFKLYDTNAPGMRPPKDIKSQKCITRNDNAWLICAAETETRKPPCKRTRMPIRSHGSMRHSTALGSEHLGIARLIQKDATGRKGSP